MEDFTPCEQPELGSLVSLGSVAKNIFDSYEDSALSDNGDRLRSFLRLRPTSASECSKVPSPFHVLDKRKLRTTAPTQSRKFKSSKGNLHDTCRVFEFNHVFDEQANQTIVFDRAVQPLVLEFTKNFENVLLFAYGTTGSGKTYTMHGGRDEPGMLPKAIKKTFDHLQGCILDQPVARPVRFRECVYLSPKEQASEQLLRTVTLGRAGYSQEACPSPTISSNSQTRFVPWVSFIELYNEQPCDLLQECASPVRLMRDAQGNFFAHGVKHVFVQNAEEAIALFQLGTQALQKHVHATGMNAVSSRSHAIFTITIVRLEEVKAENKEQKMNIKSEQEVKTYTEIKKTEGMNRGEIISKDGNLKAIKLLGVNNFALADLAGLERAKKTGNAGVRMKEAAAINKSLFCLHRCVRILRGKQTTGSIRSIVPYQESALTKLFQPFLCGFGITGMLIAINPLAVHYDETLASLEFAAVASELVIMKHKAASELRRITQIWMQSSKTWSELQGPALANNSTEWRSLGEEEMDLIESDDDRISKELTETDEEQQELTQLRSLVLQLQEQLNEVKSERNDQLLMQQVLVSQKMLEVYQRVQAQCTQANEQLLKDQAERYEQAMMQMRQDYELLCDELNEQVETLKDELFEQRELWDAKKLTYQRMIKEYRKQLKEYKGRQETEVDKCGLTDDATNSLSNCCSLECASSCYSSDEQILLLRRRVNELEQQLALRDEVQVIAVMQKK